MNDTSKDNPRTFHVTYAIQSIIILFLAIAANYTGTLLSCETQHIAQNRYAKHALLFMILFFTLVYVNRDQIVMGNDYSLVVELAIVLGYSIFIYVLFILLTKMNLIFIILVTTLLFVHVFVSDYKSTHINKDDTTKLQLYSNIERGLELTTLSILFVGVFLYYIKQQRDYGSRFSWVTFFFGVDTCARLRQP